MTTETTGAPQGVAAAEPGVTPEPTAPAPGTEQPATTPPADPPPAEPPRRDPWFVQRIHRQTAKIASLAQENETLRQALGAGRQGQDPATAPPTRQPEQPPTEAEIERRAEQLAAERAFAQDFGKWDEAASKADAAFRENCNAVAALEGGTRRDFVELLMETPDSHKLVAHLAENPADAQRILALPPHRMAVALAKLAGEAGAAKPAPASRAPAPIRPVGGTARNEPDPSKMSVEEWMRWREGQIAKR